MSAEDKFPQNSSWKDRINIRQYQNVDKTYTLSNCSVRLMQGFKMQTADYELFNGIVLSFPSLILNRKKSKALFWLAVVIFSLTEWCIYADWIADLHGDSLEWSCLKSALDNENNTIFTCSPQYAFYTVLPRSAICGLIFKLTGLGLVWQI